MFPDPISYLAYMVSSWRDVRRNVIINVDFGFTWQVLVGLNLENYAKMFEKWKKVSKNSKNSKVFNKTQKFQKLTWEVTLSFNFSRFGIVRAFEFVKTTKRKTIKSCIFSKIFDFFGVFSNKRCPLLYCAFLSNKQCPLFTVFLKIR